MTAPITLLIFGSRDATIETNIARVLDVTCPDRVVHGACGLDENDPIDPDRMKGADGIGHRLASARGIMVDLFPAAWKRLGRAAGMARNREQYRLGRPVLAAAQVTGRVGSPISVGSAGMLRICREGIRGKNRQVLYANPCPVVVYRDDGVEPDATPLRTMRFLHALFQDDRLVAPWHAVSAWKKGEAERDEVLAALTYAADGSRWAPWIEAVAATVRAT